MEITSQMLVGQTPFNFSLYPHQATLFQWMRMIDFNITNPSLMKGGIIADDMGLGKTKSACAFIALTCKPATYVGTPSSTRYAFIRECLNLFSGYINVYTIENGKYCKCSFAIDEYGVQRIVPKAIEVKRGAKLLSPYVLVSNYELVSKGTKNDKMITDLVWNTIIIDEGHFLRNNDINAWTKLSSLKQPVDMSQGFENRYGTRWVLSGTPIQMELNDLINIFRFVDNRFLTGRDIKSNNQQMQQLICTNLFRRNRYQLTTSMKRIMRYPEKEPNIFCEIVSMVDTQLSEYLRQIPYEYIYQYCSNINNARAILADEKAFCVTLASEIKYKNRGQSSGSFTESEVLRNTFSFPYVYIPNCIYDQHPGVNLPYNGKTSKVDKFVEIIKSRENEPFVIFYHYNNIRDKIEEVCRTNFPNYQIFKINGEVTSDVERDTIVQTCNKLISEGKPCFLISSILATAEGMNYQKFWNSISFDPEHNPKREDQADSRINRIGQENEVNIWRLAVSDFSTYYGIVSTDIKIQNNRDSKAHLSDIIDHFNAAWTFRRYYVINEDGYQDSGVHFSDYFESLPQGSLNGPNSTGPEWIGLVQQQQPQVISA